MMNNYAKENISTKQSPPRKEARLSRENGDQERTRRIETPPRQRTQEINGSTLLDFRLPKQSFAENRANFAGFMNGGKRFEGRLMTVFILPS